MVCETSSEWVMGLECSILECLIVLVRWAILVYLDLWTSVSILIGFPLTKLVGLSVAGPLPLGRVRMVMA